MGKVFFGLRRADRADRRAVHRAVLLQETDQRADACNAPGERPQLDAARAPRRHERADVSGLQAGDVLDLRRTAEVSGQERQKLGNVAGVGLNAVCGEPAL